jgi:hypothetical protein
LLFVATQGARLSYAGTRHWLDAADARLLDALEFAVCLDSLGGAQLSLHVSRPPKDAVTKRFYDAFTSVASAMSIPFEIVQRKINISDPEVYWEHEQFSRKKILAGTLSDLKSATVGFARSNIFDSGLPTDAAAYERNIRFVAEVLAKLVYGAESKVRIKFTSFDLFFSAWVRRMRLIIFHRPVLNNFEVTEISERTHSSISCLFFLAYFFLHQSAHRSPIRAEPRLWPSYPSFRFQASSRMVAQLLTLVSPSWHTRCCRCC